MRDLWADEKASFRAPPVNPDEVPDFDYRPQPKVSPPEEPWVPFANEGASAVRGLARQAPGGLSSLSSLSSQPEPMARHAFHGLAGEIVEAVMPHTEADEAAVLVHLLAAFGCVVGPGPRLLVGGDEHYPRLFAVIVGRTSKARKGSSWAAVRGLFGRVDPVWEAECVGGGLATGEGLIYAVRDATTQLKGGELKETDPGVTDKRLLAIESEFSRVLRVAGRDGNILGETLRQAWDSGYLRVRTRNSPLTATGAHIAVVGHITEEELRRELTATDQANGLANRFLWIAAQRSKLLAEPEPLEEETARELARRLGRMVEQSRHIDVMKRTPEAREMWAGEYERLSAERGGLAGAVVSRAEAQVTRVAMLYSLLDGTCLIEADHLQAALAVWRYAEQSAAHLFGESSGDPIEDTIATALRQRGEMSRWDISELLGRHGSAARTGIALQALATKGKAVMTRRQTGGRPAEMWSWVCEESEESEESQAPHEATPMNVNQPIATQEMK